MARRTKEEAEQTREAVLKSALDIFYEKGFSRTTFDEVAKRINLTKGAVYWHFRNKADLLAALIKQKFDIKHREIEPRDTILTVDALREQIRLHAQAIEQDPDFCKFLFFLIYQMEWSEAIAQKIGEQVREIRDFPMQRAKETLTLLQKSEQITSNINVDELASILLSAWRGTLGLYIGKQYPICFSVTVLKAFDLIMDGIIVEKK